MPPLPRRSYAGKTPLHRSTDQYGRSSSPLSVYLPALRMDRKYTCKTDLPGSLVDKLIEVNLSTDKEEKPAKADIQEFWSEWRILAERRRRMLRIPPFKWHGDC